jgi:uncharacterized repeat protein (TIGR03803 family)
MKKQIMSKRLSIQCFAVLFAVLIAASASFAAGPTKTVLYSFKGGTDAANPNSSLVADLSGNLYGTTTTGGVSGWGTVYELSPPTQQGGAWTEAVIYNFLGGSDGGGPMASLILDDAGNLYGTTLGAGGPGHDGVVFELSAPHAQGGPWTESIVHTFGGNPDGEYPVSSLVFDRAGNLYGTTVFGGRSEAGTIFQLTPPGIQGGEWIEKVLYSFTGDSDGIDPQAGLILDQAGSLYGTTGGGTVFKLSAPVGGGSNWLLHVLYAFGGSDHRGQLSAGNLLGSKQTLFGTQQFGQGSFLTGAVFQLAPGKKGSVWSESVVHQFTGGSDGKYPYAGVIADQLGNLYGTTGAGGTASAGTVFKLSHLQSGEWIEKVYSFQGGADGSGPGGGIIFGKGNVIYGTTGSGGTFGYGTVFQITP